MNMAVQYVCFRRWLFSLSMVLALVSAAAAQTPDAPQGNNLPERKPRQVAPHALPGQSGPSGNAARPSPRDHAGAMSPQVMSRQQHRRLAQNVNLEPLRTLAVFEGGRVKILGTLAREQLERIYGKQQWTDMVTDHEYGALFTYLDLVFNKGYYLDKALIHVERLPLRRDLLSHMPAAKREKWLKWGRLTPRMLMRPKARQLLRGRGGDLQAMQAAKQLRSAFVNFQRTGGRLKMVSPIAGADDWHHLQKLYDTRLASADPSAMAGLVGEVVTNPQPAKNVAQTLKQLGPAWRAGNVERVNELAGRLTQNLPRINPETYPASWRLQLEAIYNATMKFTIGYVAYGIATLTLLLAFLIGRTWLIRLGVGLLLGGYAVHLAGVVVRGLLAGRWPIHNQFESFIALTLFAVTVGLVMMLVRRQWLFGAAAGALGTASLMLANLAPIPSNDVGQVAAILVTSNILYIHVNMVLFSYGLIGLGFFVSLFYLFFYYFGQNEGPPARGLGVGAMNAAGSLPGPSGSGGLLQRFTAAGVGVLPADGTAPLRGRAALLGDLDKAQVIILQLAFWMLGTGVLLGAYWADHAWGRWWGWDPKETWALITWTVYLIAIHARFGVRRRGLTTAWLSVVGFFVMLWTYWGVNMLLAGLHSYA